MPLRSRAGLAETLDFSLSHSKPVSVYLTPAMVGIVYDVVSAQILSWSPFCIWLTKLQ
jgi:hypothetical protein